MTIGLTDQEKADLAQACASSQRLPARHQGVVRAVKEVRARVQAEKAAKKQKGSSGKKSKGGSPPKPKSSAKKSKVKKVKAKAKSVCEKSKVHVVGTPVKKPEKSTVSPVKALKMDRPNVYSRAYHTAKNAELAKGIDIEAAKAVGCEAAKRAVAGLVC